MQTSLTARLVLVLLLAAAGPIGAAEDAAPPVDPAFFQALEWRNIGPFRGGRVTAVAGIEGHPLEYYFGGTGSGVWKTEDAGISWRNVSDGFLGTGSIGAVAVAPSDPNVVYIGTGEAQIRGVTTSHGDGVYRSTDGGHTWIHLGLPESRQISRVRIHPSDADRLWVAVQGNPWEPTPERGIYRSSDGGASWQQVLYVDDATGASDLALDATNPRVLYAAFWQHRRRPWRIDSGGPGSGLYKTTDSGDSWEQLSAGLPELMGKIGVAVSPVRPERVWAIVEADEGGLFRSADGGKSFERINERRVLRARAWYYTKVVADPTDADTVYVINAPLLRSIDGGKSFTPVPTPHGDQHDLWIDPRDGRRMINGNDGGANVSTNRGATWTTQANQPTGQFYRAITDNGFPYRVYGGQQDSSTVAILSRTFDSGIGREDWHSVGGCESAHVAFDPDDPVRVYAGCYQGLIDELDVRSRRLRNVMAYPQLGLGETPVDQRYRFNWNAPIVASRHDPTTLYHAANVLLRSTDRGLSWHEISPDLTRDESAKQGPGGGPITNEAAGAETYNTLFYIAESQHEEGTLWAGSDDGLVHLTRDGGATWSDVTPPGIGETQINTIEISPHDPATAYLAVTGYKLGDMAPHVWTTDDYGSSWQERTLGIAEDAFVRVVREDPGRRGLLYAGTETGLYISFDAGDRWQPFQLDLPRVPITDLRVHEGDLVAATQGRGFWILDDVTPLHALDDATLGAEVFLFAPRPVHRVDWGEPDDAANDEGANPPSGALFAYYLAEDAVPADAAGTETADDELTMNDSAGEDGAAEDDGEGGDSAVALALAGEAVPAVRLEILDGQGQVLRTFASGEAGVEVDPPGDDPSWVGWDRPTPLPTSAGTHRVVWDLRREQLTRVPEVFVFPLPKRFRVPAGLYTVRLTVGDTIRERLLEIRADPRIDASQEDTRRHHRLVASIWDHVDELHRSVNRLRAVREQAQDRIARTGHLAAGAAIATAGEALIAAIDSWEAEVVQPAQETFQDVINYPNQLNAQLLFLLAVVDDSGPPVSTGAEQRFADLEAEAATARAEHDRILSDELGAFNAVFATHAIPAVVVPDD